MKNQFADLNFKLVVLNTLLSDGYFEKEYEKAKAKADRPPKNKKPIKALLDFVKELEIPDKALNSIDYICTDYGDDIYSDVFPEWDAEPGFFEIESIEDVKKLKKLKNFTLGFLVKEKSLDLAPLLELKNLEAINISSEFVEDSEQNSKTIKALRKKGVEVNILEENSDEEVEEEEEVEPSELGKMYKPYHHLFSELDYDGIYLNYNYYLETQPGNDFGNFGMVWLASYSSTGHLHIVHIPIASLPFDQWPVAFYNEEEGTAKILSGSIKNWFPSFLLYIINSWYEGYLYLKNEKISIPDWQKENIKALNQHKEEIIEYGRLERGDY